MNQRTLNVFCFLLIGGGFGVAPTLALAGNSDFYDRREHGWYWYEDPAPEPEAEEADEAEEAKVVVPPQKPLSAKEIIDAQRVEFEEAQAAAVVNPTPENYQRFLAILTKINEQGQRFSDGFKKAIWTNPEYDYRLTGRPTDPQALIEHNVAKSSENAQKIYEIASKKGILYFFRSDCPYCKRFSPIIKRYSEQYGFTVIPIALDGIGSEEYPYPKTSYYMQERLNVSVVPATFLVDPDANTVATIGYGYSDWTTFQAKILFADEQLEGSSPSLAGN